MTRIVVFDSGFGSLSIIRSIQKITKAEIIYFADQKNFPYGNKTKLELKKIINHTLKKLQKKFKPDIIVIASNTPSILFQNYLNSKIIGVLPPLNDAIKFSKTSNIGVLATSAAIKSKDFIKYVKCVVPQNFSVKKIDATDFIELVESGKFITNKKYCKQIIKARLAGIISKHNIDVVTLSSTHLPFLSIMLKEQFPNVRFLDPADEIAIKIAKKISIPLKRNKLEIYTSKNPKLFQKYLKKIGIKNKINFLP